MNISESANPLKRSYQILEIVSQSRSIIYRMLALCLTTPDNTIIDLLRSGKLICELRAATIYLGNDQIGLLEPITFLEKFSNITLDFLQAEYSHLFETGISRIPPREYAYRWKDACHLSQSEADLRQSLQHQYNSYGVHCDLGTEDHISVEIEYLAFLCDQESIHWSNELSKVARDIRSHERAFVDDHLGRWFPEFFYRVQKLAPQSFYSHIAQFCDLWFCLDHGAGYGTVKDYQ